MSATQRLAERFFELHPNEVAWQLEAMEPGLCQRVFDTVPVHKSAAALVSLEPDRAASVLGALTQDRFKEMVPHLDPERTAAILSRLPESTRNERLSWLPAATSSELQGLMHYPSDSAGALMDPYVLIFKEKELVESAIARIRAATKKKILDLCVAGQDGTLAGVISLRRLVAADPSTSLDQLISREPIRVQAMESKEQVVELLDKNKLSSLPVVDAQDRLVGVIRYDALLRAVQQEASADIGAMVGVSPQEKALSKVGFAVKKRLPWLQINLVTTFIAASIVGLFENTIAKFTALAVLLPVVAGQSGNTGAQALAVVVRGLALREIRVRQWVPVLTKEVGVGFVNGVFVGLTCAAGIYFWSGSSGLALVIGLSMVLSMVIASLAGAAVPILLTVFRLDPAQSSSIVLTTITDVFGFLSFLGLATLLSHLLEVA